MRRSLFRLLPLFLAALWLPFHAIAATAMPLGGHGAMHTVAGDEATEHCDKHHEQAAADQGLACDQCGVCHLIAAGFLPSIERVSTAIPAVQDYRLDAQLAPPSAIPEPPQQPPKRLA